MSDRLDAVARLYDEVAAELDRAAAAGFEPASLGRTVLRAETAGVVAAAEKALDQAKQIFEGLQHGKIDRSLFTANANAYFGEQALKDFASSLGPLGKPQEFTQQSQALRGGMTLRRYSIRFPKKTLRLTTFWLPDNKLEQYQLAE